MSAMNLAHQNHLFDPSHARPVHLIGAGSVGSWVATLLARAGVENITVWDDDSVASHNVPMSAYGVSDVGKPKVLALYERVLADTGVKLNIKEQMYEGEAIRNASIVCSVDTMKARELAWRVIRARGVMTVDLFCDTRTHSAFVEVLSVCPFKEDEAALYESLLYSDADALPSICGLHGVAYAASRAAGIVVANLTRNWTSNQYSWRVVERCDTLERVI